MGLLFKFLLVLLIVFCNWGCTTTCHTTLINTIPQGEWNADLMFRICGSASGFAVSVYSDDEGPPGVGQGYLEPFKTNYPRDRHRHLSPCPAPIKINWIGDKHLEIKHLTRTDLEDSSTDLMIMKAEPAYKGISISYEPKPVFWE